MYVFYIVESSSSLLLSLGSGVLSSFGTLKILEDLVQLVKEPSLLSHAKVKIDLQGSKLSLLVIVTKKGLFETWMPPKRSDSMPEEINMLVPSSKESTTIDQLHAPKLILGNLRGQKGYFFRHLRFGLFAQKVQMYTIIISLH